MPDEAGGTYVNPTGEFSRDQRYIATRITADGRDGYPVEPGRYRLAASRACPGPTRGAGSWPFGLDPGGRYPVLGIDRLQEAFLARFPDYDKGITVPAIVD